jgi:hypothetical protein
VSRLARFEGSKVRRFLLICLVSVVGCQDDSIRTTRVPRSKPVALRTLAALVPQPDAVWFFKISGPAEMVAADEEKFRLLLGSVLFASDPPIRYAIPDGWRLDAGGGKTRGGMVSRFATLRTPNGNEAVITKLGPESSDVLPNVNRWRREIGLGPIESGELPSVSRELTVGGSKSILVDLRGTGEELAAGHLAPPPNQRPKTAPVAPPPPAANSGLEFKAPADWTQTPASGMRVAAFRVGEGAQAAELTIIPLGPASGTVEQNVNRWRNELKLEELDPGKLKPTLRTLTVEGAPATYVNLLGPDGPARQQTLGVIIPRANAVWFVKLRGAAATVTAHQAKFEDFVQSLKLPPGDR